MNFPQLNESEELDRRIEESKQVALDIEDGKKSRYWNHLLNKISRWLTAEYKHLELLNMRLIRSPDDAEERNDVVKRIALLHQFLKINETIIDENLNMIDGMRIDTPERFFKNKNFVGQKPMETQSDGR